MEGIRKAAIWAQGRLCKVWYKCVVAMDTESRESIEYLLNSTFLSFAATVRTDCDRSVVIATLETLEDLLKSLKGNSPFPLTQKPLSSLLVSLQDIFNNKVTTYCLHVHADRGRAQPMCVGVGSCDVFIPIFKATL